MSGLLWCQKNEKNECKMYGLKLTDLSVLNPFRCRISISIPLTEFKAKISYRKTVIIGLNKIL